MRMTRPRIDQTENQFEEVWSAAGRGVTENHSTGRLWVWGMRGLVADHIFGMITVSMT
jgi:hypothetical protein